MQRRHMAGVWEPFQLLTSSFRGLKARGDHYWSLYQLGGTEQGKPKRLKAAIQAESRLTRPCRALSACRGFLLVTKPQVSFHEKQESPLCVCLFCFRCFLCVCGVVLRGPPRPQAPQVERRNSPLKDGKPTIKSAEFSPRPQPNGPVWLPIQYPNYSMYATCLPAVTLMGRLSLPFA